MDQPKLPAVEDLAQAFAMVLLSWLTPQEWREMCRLNRAETHPGVCHSGDFCDSNMAMDEAFQYFGIEPLDYPPGKDPETGMDDEVNRLWNAAWDFAKYHYLS